MSSTTEFDRMADACINAGKAVMQSGSEELKAVVEIMLFILGEEIARNCSVNDAGLYDLKLSGSKADVLAAA